MVFHVTGAAGIFRIGRIAQKFRNDGPERLAENVVEHIQPAAMRHADDNLANAELRAAFQDLLDRRDHRLGAVHAEPLGACVFLVKVLLELLGIDKALIDRLLAALGEVGAVADGLDALLDPGLLGRVLNMHELDADRAAICAAQRFDDLAKRRRLETEDVIDEDRTVPVLVGEAVGGRVEFRVKRLVLERQRVEIGNEMPADAVGPDQHHGAKRVECRRPHVISIHMPSGSMAGRHGIDRVSRVGGADDAAAVSCPARSPIDLGGHVADCVQLFEIARPPRVDGRGVAPPGGVHLGNEGGVCRRKEGQIEVVILVR